MAKSIQLSVRLIYFHSISSFLFQIYERFITTIKGLARLVLEKLYETDVRNSFSMSRGVLRGTSRSNPDDMFRRYRRRKNKYKGDLKAETSVVRLEMNDHDVSNLHIPYGPGWTARRIDKLGITLCFKFSWRIGLVPLCMKQISSRRNAYRAILKGIRKSCPYSP